MRCGRRRRGAWGCRGYRSCSRYRSYPRCRGWRYYGATDVAGCAPLPGLPILLGLPGLPLPPGLPVLTLLPKLPVLPGLLPPPAVPAEPGRRAQGGEGACRRTLLSLCGSEEETSKPAWRGFAERELLEEGAAPPVNAPGDRPGPVRSSWRGLGCV